MFKLKNGQNFLFILVAALVLNAVMPFFAYCNIQLSKHSNQIAADNIKSIFGDDLVICTVDGFKVVKLSQTENDNPSENDDINYQCNKCLIIANAAFDDLDSQDQPRVKFAGLNIKSIAIIDPAVDITAAFVNHYKRGPPNIVKSYS